MSDFNSVGGVSLASLGVRARDEKHHKKELGQEDFMKLLITQLKHQDPMQPQDNGEFIAQMAQFGTLDSMQKLNNHFNQFQESVQSMQALQASSLVGKSALVNGDDIHFTGEQPVSFTINVPQSTDDVSYQITNNQGQIVKDGQVGVSPQGKLTLDWDGKDSGGLVLPKGQYQLKATATINGSQTALATEVAQKIHSVNLKNGGDVTLNVANRGELSLQQVSTLQ